MSGIYALLKRFDTDAPHDVDEALHFAFSIFEIDMDQLFDDVGHLLL
jgi:hypothetical protein